MDGVAGTSGSTLHESPAPALTDELAGEEDVTLSALLVRTLRAASELLESAELSTPAAQQRLGETLASLSLCASLVAHLAVLSANEAVDELPTPALRALLVPYYAGMLELQRRTRDYAARSEALASAHDSLKRFVARCDDYELLDADRRRRLFLAGPAGSSTGSSSAVTNDPARRREAKIAQYREEKALRSQLEQLEARSSARPGSSVATGSVNGRSEEDADDEYLRPLLLTQIALCYLRAHGELASIGQELELLAAAPNMSELPTRAEERERRLAQDGRERRRDAEDRTWRLDAPAGSSSLAGGGSPHAQLIDARGRPLRPFTILPSAATAGALDTRLRLQASVFGPSHRLPTMSIDEYLDLEAQRGNILQGGGARNTEESRAEAEQKRAHDEEEDSLAGYAREEAGLAKKREWDAYRDEHRRGEGNRLNQG